MSFEGYYQLLCRKGHYYLNDVHAEGRTEACPFCGDPWAWENLVDTTNGSFAQEEGVHIDGAIKLLKKSAPHAERTAYWLPLGVGTMLPGHPYYEPPQRAFRVFKIHQASQDYKDRLEMVGAVCEECGDPPFVAYCSTDEAGDYVVHYCEDCASLLGLLEGLK